MIIWYKDLNNRVYHDKQGVKHSAPIEREYWRPVEVVDETNRSWHLANGLKVPKNTMFPTASVALNEEQVDATAWFDDNVHKIAQGVNDLNFGIEHYRNIEKLRAVADAIDYKPQ